MGGVKDMQKMGVAWILIVLGLIVIALSLLSLIPVSLISIFLLFMLGAGLILDGIYETGEIEGASLGIPLLILGIISIILEIGFIFNFPLMSELAGFIIWIIALFLIITGIIRILSKNGDKRCGVKDINNRFVNPISRNILSNIPMDYRSISRSMDINHRNEDTPQP